MTFNDLANSAPVPTTYAERMAWEAAEFAEMADAAAECTAAMRRSCADDSILRKNASVAATVTSLADLEARLRRLATQPLPLPLRTMEAAGSA